MKKIITTLSALALIMTLTTSCNKKLKENMDDLEQSLNEQKNYNNNLQNQVNTLNGILARTPASVQFSTRDNNDASFSWQGDLSFVYGSDYTHSFIVENKEDGRYYVYLWRGADLESDFSTRVEFVYNPVTKVVSGVTARFRGYTGAGDYVNANFSGTANITQTVTVSAFDTNGGTVSFNYSAATTGDYSGNRYSGKGMNLSVQYSGLMVKSASAGL